MSEAAEIDRLVNRLIAQIETVERLMAIDAEAYEGEAGMLLPKLREQLAALPEPTKETKL